jgi:hypothetical protein
MFSNIFSENRTINLIMWENMGEKDRPQMTIQRMCFACWVSKVTDTHSECVIQGGSNMTGTCAACLYTNQSRSYFNHLVLISFPRQEWLRERALTLRCIDTEPPVNRYCDQL